MQVQIAENSTISRKLSPILWGLTGGWVLLRAILLNILLIDYDYDVMPYRIFKYTQDLYLYLTLESINDHSLFDQLSIGSLVSSYRIKIYILLGFGIITCVFCTTKIIDPLKVKFYGFICKWIKSHNISMNPSQCINLLGFIISGIIFICYIIPGFFGLAAAIIDHYESNHNITNSKPNASTSQNQATTLINSTIASDIDGMIEKLEKLGKLKEQGILTDEEFQNEKNHLLL